MSGLLVSQKQLVSFTFLPTSCPDRRNCSSSSSRRRFQPIYVSVRQQQVRTSPVDRVGGRVRTIGSRLWFQTRIQARRPLIGSRETNKRQTANRKNPQHSGSQGNPSAVGAINSMRDRCCLRGSGMKRVKRVTTAGCQQAFSFLLFVVFKRFLHN